VKLAGTSKYVLAMFIADCKVILLEVIFAPKIIAGKTNIKKTKRYFFKTVTSFRTYSKPTSKFESLLRQVSLRNLSSLRCEGFLMGNLPYARLSVKYFGF
jgi:hypothetical protein